MGEKMLVSACLAGKPCRYDGKSKPDPRILELIEEGRAVLCCPECDGGLATPRIPAERQGNRVVNQEGEDVTDFYQRGAETALELCKENNIKTAVLKAKSPSCGNDMIYDGTFTGKLISGEGVAAELLRKNGIEVINEEQFEKVRKAYE